jgi:hypothetical protein
LVRFWTEHQKLNFQTRRTIWQEWSCLPNELNSLYAGWGGRVLSQKPLDRKSLRNQTNSGDIEWCVASKCSIIKPSEMRSFNKLFRAS